MKKSFNIYQKNIRWLILIKTYQYRWLNISMLRINSTEWKLRWGRVKMYFGGNLWKWILLPLASSWQLMPDSGMASKVAIWVGLDKVKQLGDRPSDSPVNLALKVSKLHHQRMLGPLHFISDTSRYDLALICRIFRVWHFSTLSFSRFINLSIFFIRIYWNCWSMG